MYEFLRGTAVRVMAGEVVLDVHGVGYRLTVPTSTSDAVEESADEVKLLVEFVVREDEQRLFGFATAAERRLFRLLVGVNGVGPTVAVAIVSEHSLATFRAAVLEDDAKRLQSVKGVGRRLSQRLIVELKDRMRELELPDADATTGGAAVADATLALVALGYPRRQAKDALARAVEQGVPADDAGELVRGALRHL